MNEFSIEDDIDDDEDDDDEDDVGTGDVDDDKEYEDAEGSEDMLASNNGDSFQQGYLYHGLLSVKVFFNFYLFIFPNTVGLVCNFLLVNMELLYLFYSKILINIMGLRLF